MVLVWPFTQILQILAIFLLLIFSSLTILNVVVEITYQNKF
jgi:hypothetical protein